MMPKVSTIEHGGGLTRACALYGGQPGEWLDLSTGINPVPVPVPQIAQDIWCRLPDESLMERASLGAAKAYGAAPGIMPLPVAGIQCVIPLLPQLFDGPVAILGPTYEEYRLRFAQAGCAVDVISDIGEIAAHHKLAVIVNPNNPDGRVVAPETVLSLVLNMRERGGLVIVDEAFADMRPEVSVCALAGQHENLIVLRSFGKFYGLAGIRLGFVVAAPDILCRIRDAQGPWAVSGPSLEIARALLSDGAAAAEIARQIVPRRQALGEVLSDAGLKVLGGTDLFALVEDDRAAAIFQALCKSHILTRPFSYAPQWLRFGLCPDSTSEARLRLALRNHFDC
ncbi:MAG: threonine-phosphate decarboxylase CobD [Rhizobiaceae bacterium]|nr:threonine-phosphate decarboxylase CobD [Rhizobiaceae bacterium]